MLYRDMGGLGQKVSALGFGCMRLPSLDGLSSSRNIDEAQAISIIRNGIDNGIDYIDTAYPYHGGMSEPLVGRALQDGYRDKVKLATKAPVVAMKQAADFDRILDEQLVKLQVDLIDFYLFHGIGEQSWGFIQDHDLIGRAEAARKAGKIGHICFSFHDRYEVFEQIINGYDGWSMVQVQYNFMDIDFQAGTKGVQLAASKGLAVVAMEPLRGGKLGTAIPEVQACMDRHGYDGTLAELALRWLWGQPEVSLALSGMSDAEQVRLNLASAERYGNSRLTDDEYALIADIRAIYNQRTGIPCTDCNYCMPCPNGVKIPDAFGLYNEATIYEHKDESVRVYNLFGRPAQGCTQCGECDGKCPQQIEVSTLIPKVHAFLNEG